MKFGAGSEQRDSHRYPNVFQRQRFSDGQQRLQIGPGRDHVELLIELIECLPEPLRLLYVLVVPRGRHQSGRYEAVAEMSFDDAESFLREFADFLQSDGRHHVWIASPGFGTVVYDRHDLIYAYGPVDKFVEVVETNGLKEGTVSIPAIHWHGYHAEFDAAESQVLSRFQWVHSRLHRDDNA